MRFRGEMVESIRKAVFCSCFCPAEPHMPSSCIFTSIACFNLCTSASYTCPALCRAFLLLC